MVRLRYIHFLVQNFWVKSAAMEAPRSEDDVDFYATAIDESDSSNATIASIALRARDCRGSC